MATIHFLNVKEGDCCIVEHDSGHTTVIDVCNAEPIEPMLEALTARMAKSERASVGTSSRRSTR